MSQLPDGLVPVASRAVASVILDRVPAARRRTYPSNLNQSVDLLDRLKKRQTIPLITIAAEIGWRKTNAIVKSCFIVNSKAIAGRISGERFLNQMKGSNIATVGKNRKMLASEQIYTPTIARRAFNVPLGSMHHFSKHLTNMFSQI